MVTAGGRQESALLDILGREREKMARTAAVETIVLSKVSWEPKFLS